MHHVLIRSQFCTLRACPSPVEQNRYGGGRAYVKACEPRFPSDGSAATTPSHGADTALSHLGGSVVGETAGAGATGFAVRAPLLLLPGSR